MHLLPAIRRDWRRGWLGMFSWRRAAAEVGSSGAIVLMVFGAIAFSQAPAIDPRAAAEMNGGDAGVYLPTDRTLSRAMSRAKEWLAAGEYHAALAFLQDVLARDEDAFLDDPASATKPTGLKTTARRWIGELPAAGREAYELLEGAAARRELDAALTAGDQHGVAQVVRKYFHTAAGYEAALLLAQIESDHGRQMAAGQLYQELLESPIAAEKFEPQLSVLAALNHLAAGHAEQAAETLRKLAEKNPAATLELAGRTATVPGKGRDPLAWLQQLVGQPLATAASESNWLTLHGAATRHVRPAGGAPHLRARWKARVVNDPSMESFLATRSESFEQRGVVAIPAARPLAVGDVVLVRTPHNVVAVDWRTGKRMWETREEEELDNVDLLAIEAGGRDSDEWSTPNSPLEQRVWDDVLAMSLGSDGERVFVIRGLSTPSAEEAAWQIAPFGGGAGLAVSATNRLAAYDLATEGKLVWELDGERPAGPLADAFFLGAPLAIDDLVFVLAEIRSAVYLLALDPVTGKLEWQQQLVGLEQGIGLDPQRRFLGLAPSYAGGILVCPTGAGAVIAIDIVKREFAWVYRYPRKIPTAADLRNSWQQQIQGQSTRLNERWLDGSAIIVGDRVLVTPPESGELHCLDLRRGELVWKHPRSDALFVGGVDQGIVVLVSNDSLQGVNLSDRSPAWGDKTLALPKNALPAGQGYVSEGRLYLPLTTGAMIGVDMANGTIASTIETDHHEPLGNLICYRGSVLSQSATMLDKFEQLDVLGQRAEAALAANPNDPTAIRELAEMRRVDGKLAESIELLKRAHELAPDDALIEEMLAEGLLDVLREDFVTHRDELPLVRRLIRGRDQEIELLRIEARGLEALDERIAALDAYLRLLDITVDQPIEMQISADYRVRSDRWINGSLGRLWADAAADQRAAIVSEIAERRPAMDNEPDAWELRRYLAQFDRLPGADEVRLKLARIMVEQEFTQEAELQLLQLGASDAPQSQAASAVLMTKMLLAAGEYEHAAAYVGLLRGRWHDTPALNGLTGAEWAQRLASAEAAVQHARSRAWPVGRVKAAVRPVVSAKPTRERIHRAPVERQYGYRSLQIKQDFGLATDTTQWFVTSDLSQLIGRDGMGNDVYQLTIEQSRSRRPYRDNNFVQAARLGHLLFVSHGGQIRAIESRRGEHGATADVLWQADPEGRYPTTRVRSRSQRRIEIFHDWSGRRRVSGANGPTLRDVGPATPRGVIVQEQDEVKCLDPLTGETLWSRTGLPVACELFGDDEVIVAVDLETGTGRLLSTIDGRDLGERELPSFPWTLTAGRNVVYHATEGEGEKRKLALRVTDVVSERTIFEGEYDTGTRLAVVEPKSVAVLEPTGSFQLVNAETGAVVIEQPVEPVSRSHRIETMLSGELLFVVINSQPTHQLHGKIGVDFPVVNGMVYAFSMTSGEALWPSPAVVRSRGVALTQPHAIPLLVFVDRKSTQGAGGGGAMLRLLCIDKATGQAVYRNDELPDTAGSRLEIHGSGGASPSVTVEMSNREVKLALTEEPRPPAPPANDDLETPPLHEDRGLWGVGRRIGEVLQGALENRPPADQAPPAPEEAPQDIDPAPNGAGENELDDD